MRGTGPKAMFPGLLVTLLLAGGGCGGTAPRTEPLPFLPTAERLRESPYPGVFYTLHILLVAHQEHGLVEELWQYLDEDAPQGASRELRRKNNLRVGLLTERFRPAAQAVMERLYTRRLSPIPTFCPAGKVQLFPCGRTREGVDLFLWASEDELLGRSFPRLSLEMEVAAVPAGEQVAELTITPTLVLGPGKRQGLAPLRTVLRCPVGGSVVIGAVDPRGRMLGQFFQNTVNSPDDREQLLIITVDAVRPEQAGTTSPFPP